MEKKELRREMRDRLARLSPEERRSRSLAITGRLVDTGWWTAARTVLAFRSMAEEADTSFLIRTALEQGRTVAVPRIDGEELVFHRIRGLEEPSTPGVFGILEPAAGLPAVGPDELGSRRTLVVTPGLAFDRRMNRLGRGRGYYDRFLAWARGIAGGELKAVGIGFCEQLVESVPVTERDQPLDGLVFDTAVWRPADRPF